jgi:hypothetical protein
LDLIAMRCAACQAVCYVTEEVRRQMQHCPSCGKTLSHPSAGSVRAAPEVAPSFHLEPGNGEAALEVKPGPRGNVAPSLRDAVNQFSRSLAEDGRAGNAGEDEDSAAAESYDVDDDGVVEERSSEPRRRRRRRKGRQPPPELATTLRVGGIVVAVLVLSTVLAIRMPSLSQVMVAGGFILFLVGIIWLRRVLAMEGLVSRLVCQLVPGYSLFHLLKNREPNTTPGVLQLGGFLFLVSGGVVYAWLGGVGVAPSITPQTSVVIGNSHAVDAQCAKLSTNKTEAAEWLKDPDGKHGLANYRHDQAVTLVEALERRKAAHVFVAGIRTKGDEQTATRLVIELAPRNALERRHMFAWCNKYLIHDKELAIPDDDQKYLLLKLDTPVAP